MNRATSIISKLLFALLLSITFMACSSSTNNEEGNSDAPISDNNADSLITTALDTLIQELEAEFDFSQNFARTYQGKIGNIPVHLNLMKTGEKLSGNYYYDKVGIPIYLSEGKVNANGYFSFKERNMVHEETGLFMGQLKGNVLEAIWQSPDRKRKLEVQLVSDIDPASKEQVSFQVFYEEMMGFYDSNDTTSPHYTFIYTTVFPSNNYEGPAKDELYRQIEQYFGEFAEKGNPRRSIDALYQESFKEYKESIQDFVGEEGMAYAMNWSTIVDIEVIYNSQGVLSISAGDFSYSGGAHGNYSRGLNSYEIATGKQILLKDVFAEGFKAPVKNLIISAIKEQQGLGAGDDIAEVGYYEESIEATENFCLTHKGIVFYYSPYAIAPYAAGPTEVFIPFEDCQAFLKPDGLVKSLLM